MVLDQKLGAMSAPEGGACDLLPAGAPRLGFGCGDLFAGPQSTRLVEAALEVGIRYFDVARLYGDGQAEGVLGGVLPRVRDRVVIASKAGIVPWSMQTGARLKAKAARTLRRLPPLAGIVPEPAPPRERYGVFAARELERSVETSLRALRTDYLDVLLLHECALADVSDETLSLLERLRAQGKIRRFGVATHFADTVEIATRRPRAAAIVQFPSDAFNRNVEQLPHDERELVITHSPLKNALPRLLATLADPAAGMAWRAATGVEPDDRNALARLLLSAAIEQNRSGLVLFSTSKAERLGEAVRAAEPLSPEHGLALREVVSRAGLKPAQAM